MAVSVLMFGTLVIVLVLGVTLWVKFMAKPANRHPMAGDRERNIEEIRNEGPNDV